MFVTARSNFVHANNVMLFWFVNGTPFTKNRCRSCCSLPFCEDNAHWCWDWDKVNDTEWWCYAIWTSEGTESVVWNSGGERGTASEAQSVQNKRHPVSTRLIIQTSELELEWNVPRAQTRMIENSDTFETLHGCQSAKVLAPLNHVAWTLVPCVIRKKKRERWLKKVEHDVSFFHKSILRINERG
jgi:hypothetical protein